ncbi:MAG: iron-containing alcohol dehydrogenase [Clostridiales bacterium]|nr:iron-containing alcohol dehydrogenase [Clostridiales bacterium]
MDNFIYQNQTKIVFGKDTENMVGSLIAPTYKKVLLHYGGGSIKKSGLYDRVIASLEKSGVDYIELSGVAPNPRLSLVNEGIALCRENDVDFILAVGGGSVIDSAKAIAIGVLYDGDVWDFFIGKKKAEDSLPFGSIVTIPAAGSENSVSCVVTNDDINIKKGMVSTRAEFAILNPELTYTLPPYQSAAGAIDILAHVMERYFTPTPDVGFTDRLCEATMKTIIDNAPIIMENPEDYNARAQIMWASTIAHNGLLNTGRLGDWASHHIQHAMGGMVDMAHGAGLAVVFPAWMQYVYKHDIARFKQFAMRVWDMDAAFGSDEDIVLEGIRRYKAFAQSLGLPTTLKELGISEEWIPKMAKICGRDGKFVVLEVSDIIEIYKLALV